MSNKLPYLLTGFIGSAYGIMIFFVLPLSVLSFNLGLLFEIFFLILVGMIFGLTLISINLQIYSLTLGCIIFIIVSSQNLLLLLE